MSERSLQTDPASSDHTLGAAPLLEAGTQRAPAGPMLLEISTEVCNQVGGIYQVIRSKAPLMVQRWGERYCLVGPWDPSKAQVEFEESRPAGWIARALAALKERGLIVHYGRWLVPGRPRVMLLEWGLSGERLAAVKYELWAHHEIESPGGDGLIDFVVSFSEAVRRLVEALCEFKPAAQNKGEPPIVAHFHEWLAGPAIPMIRRQNLPVASVFTTHATVLGRCIAGNREAFYDQLPWLDHMEEARRYNCVAQHTIERAAAHGCHVFTTVSSITGEECASLLGRPIDLVVPNGLTIGLYNAGHEQQRLHGEYKETIHRFTMGHFFPSYGMDLDRTLYFFTSGRFEPKNKGFDLCLEAMARLNADLKAANLGKNVVFFIVTKRPTHSINPLAMEKRGVLNELNEVCQKIVAGVGPRLFTRSAMGGKLHLDDLVDEYWMLRYRRARQALRHQGLPMVVTHLLEDDRNDPVLNQIRMLGLLNREEDPVKVVYHPDFINPHNRLWGIEYDQFVRGCHLGIFPSVYEPWGYTPLECAAMGVPAVTSDLAGFGKFVQENYEEPEKFGMLVLKRRGRGYHDVAAELSRYLLEFCRLERRDRIALRNEVDRKSWDFDWARLGRAYHTAHDLALARCQGDQSIQAGGPDLGVAMVSANQLAPHAVRTDPGEGRAQSAV